MEAEVIHTILCRRHKISEYHNGRQFMIKPFPIVKSRDEHAMIYSNSEPWESEFERYVKKA